MKRFKTKRKFNKKKYVILIISFILFMILFIWISLHNLNSQKSSFVTILLKKFDNNVQTKESVISHLTSNLDYLLQTPHFMTQEKVVSNDYMPLVYIYNTHDQEKYQDNKTVIDASLALSNNLKKLGITSIVEERLPSSFASTGLSYYEISKTFILNTKEKYPNVEYYIDIHRDSVKNTTVTIKNKKYAKILFVLGLDNEKYKENKLILEKMNNYLNSNYPGISKGILEKKGKEVNGIYNQDIGNNVLLIEIGGIENNFEEVNNSTEIIALMLYNMLGDINEKIS